MKEQSTLILQKEVLPFLNISLYLNNIRLIQSLSLENASETDVLSLEVWVNADLPCIEPFHSVVPFLPAGADVKIPVDHIKVNRDFLSKLSETEKAIVTIEVVKEDVVLATESVSVDIHPFEYFGGIQVLPELIAAYVTPNHPYIYYIKRKAVEVLERQGLATAFEGYQRDDPTRVLQMMSAIYSAIQSEAIVYSSLPPSYEERGQRLRLLTTIQQEKFGNCIDLSLLFAACLEAVDLNPILILVRGHAFVGCWLRDDKFPEIINEDKTAITKRLSKGIREIAAVEATTVCRGNDIRFSDALNLGEARLVEKEDFQMSVDIKRARTAFIRPLPLFTDATGLKLDEEAVQKTEVANMENRFEIGTIYQEELLQVSQSKTKQKVWERKLLDLSLRNNLLNLRMTRSMLQMVDIDISHLEDTLAEGKSFSIMPDSRAEVLRRYNLFSQPLHHSSPLYQLANDELKYNRLLTNYHQQDLDNILTYIHKNAKQAIEENGSSTLYLAVGLLKWYDRKTPEQARFAPILLVPVEISRRSVNSKFTLKSREEETMINITLVEFLRQEYELNLGSLEQLPYDDKGVDVAKVMGTLRRAVMQLKGWDVEEQLVLGNFSFSKLILWKDMVAHQEDLLKSHMVQSLVEGKLAFYHGEEIPENDDLDNIQAQSLALPIPTDVSQMEAVLTAQRGHSFILHGPPGTGKSQTITNIIADALNRGKRVLFVAAKKAALDVVHRRLEQIGLGSSSLELHSNKSKKSDVLEQLSKSLQTARLARTADFAQESERLDAARKAISDYVNVLHQKQLVGWSLYDSITALENHRNIPFEKRRIPETVLEQLSPGLWQQWTDWLPQFQSVIQLVIHPDENPLAALQLPNYTPSINEAIATQSKGLLELLPEARRHAEALAAAVQFPFPIQSKKEWVGFVEVILALKELPDIPLSFFGYMSDKRNKGIYEEWSQHFQQYQTSWQSLLKDYNRNILNMDIASLEMRWKKAQQSWFLPQWWNKRTIKKQIATFKNVPLQAENEVEHLFSQHHRMVEAQGMLQQNRFAEMQKALGNLFREEQTDLPDIDRKADSLRQLDNKMRPWGNRSLSDWTQGLLDKNYGYSEEIINSHSTLLKGFLKLTEKLEEQTTNYGSLTGLRFQQEENWLEETTVQLQGILAHLPELKNWMNYIHIANQGKALHLQWLIDAYRNKWCEAEHVTAYFNYTVHAAIAEQVIARHESLSLFNVGLFENKIEQYKKIAGDFRKLTIRELQMKLAAQLPNIAMEAMQSSEIGILQRAIRSKGRGLSIRRLFDQIPTLLPRLAPCMLMSPISVAQYFDVNTDHFDLVIFDEASQLPTCEAVSALARAKQAVIVGDPKQMPPTSFFNTIKLDEENMDVEDLESILDDCLSLSVPSKYLLRHYRSKHESLIAFSNVNYYDNKLLTFPSADDLNRKVQYHQVVGFYDKGKTRTNRFEADAIVQYIKAHYTDAQKRKLSLGVVTFSQTQQNLVEDKLQQLFMSDVQLEELANESTEPLFVKNLENVQGDERDIILFSVGYAADEEGKLSMNFGPLNRNGGWRRLNVAITRSRYEMHVFATLKSDQIDLSRTSAEGVAGLKAFLHFAEKGHLALRAEDLQAIQDRQHLSDAIGKCLQEKGLNVQCNIGTSGFKIDIGIIHPEKPQQYILGIVLDGHPYYDARTTNDREMVMPSVLKALGWNIHRIWTMDWYENADRLIDAVLEKVEALLAQPEAETDPIDEPAIPSEIEPINGVEQQEVPVNGSTLQRPYVATVLLPVINGSSESIYEFHHREKIKSQIMEVVNREAPISKSLLYRRILQAWNVSRAGARLDAHLDSIIQEAGLASVKHHQPFYVSTDTNPSNLKMAHYRTNDIEKRSIEDIAPEELAIAVIEAVYQNLSIEEEELLRYTARLFGFAKVGRQIDASIRYAVDLAVNQGRIVRENGRVRVL